ncbi:phage baseplate upper protein [Bacillus wiedmannii]|uniref:BppU family phage baseplate upper protein n=1 Tax=Bacillus wiedmannii TaxID=1890302 RepID=UPI001CBEC375|nr:BppU family phage baseplate upper protein [Bacillus wiedmannii]MBZ4222502.1 phage baseplate upper protein [Bacillus wiedmannii]
MRTETMLIDLANMSMTRTISSRENDRNGFKIIVPLKERGKPVDLTGYVVKYEAISPYGNFVRDDVVVTSAKDGVFEYIVSKEAVSSSGVWIGYFAFEKGTERFTTQDIRISLGSDVKQGSIQIENYIAEFDKLKKQIDALQIAVDKANVVKKSGDTMTGDLKLERTGTLARDIQWSKDNVIQTNLGMNSANKLRLYDNVNALTAFEYDTVSKSFNVLSNTNLLKKAEVFTDITQPNGDSVIQASNATNDILQMVLDAGRGFRTIYAAGSALNVPSPGVGIRGFANMQGLTYGYIIATDNRNRTWTNFINGAGWQGWVNVNGNDKDTTWTNLTLINGATVDAGNTPKYIRKGDVVYIVGAVTNITDSMTIVNLPTGLKPTSNCAFAVAYLSTDSKKYTGEINVRPDGRITLDWMWNNVKSVSFCISYHL